MKRYVKLICCIIVICVTIFGIYKMVSLAKLQKIYEKDEKTISTQIENAKTKKEVLQSQLDNINSEETVEEYAREKMDMYKPNDIIFSEK